MKKILFILIFIFPFFSLSAASLGESLSGRIVLEVERNGEAWYLEPVLGEPLFLGRPRDAFEIMRSVGLGISNQDFRNFSGTAPKKFSGRILLQVEENGEAWYVNPLDLKLNYLGRPFDAFEIMRKLGLGISTNDFNHLQIRVNKEIVLQEVPFTSQAPYGDWSDERQQEGCEEASVLMAVRWARGESLTSEEALSEIIKISEYELENYGQYIDTSARDTLDRIIKDYFDFEQAKLFENVTKEELKEELIAGGIIIAPSAGRELGNPNFTAPGPLIHMLIIKGYDREKQEFITNDPGTRNGESYRYDEDILFAAISDYMTGKHSLTKEKTVIVVNK